MLKNKRIILFGAGTVGRRALNFFGAERVYCFADNKKGGQTFWGKEIISFDRLLKIKNGYDIILSVGAVNIPELEIQFSTNSIHYQKFSDMVSHEMYEINPEILQFKDKHKWERCFLIGNGPSLNANDLTTLQKRSDVSFGCNSISRIFKQTQWRPDYHVVSDPNYFITMVEELAKTEAGYKFYPNPSDSCSYDTTDIEQKLYDGYGEVFFYNNISDYSIDKMPGFSPDAARGLYGCGTVMYNMIQLAVYMGFQSIYLLGVDGNSVMPNNANVYLSEKRHFYNENEFQIRSYSSTTKTYDSDISAILIKNAYLSAERYTCEHGINIFNATRGGAIDIFRRVNFDSLFAS